MKKIFLFVILTATLTFAQNQAPTPGNITAVQRTDGTYIVDIYYDLTDPDGDAMTVTIQASSDAGTTWYFAITSVTGDVGAGITSGTQKHIVWDFDADHTEYYSDQIKLKIIADDNYVDVSCPGIPTVTYSGKTYNTVQIGNQCWLKENLDVGTMINGNSNPSNNGIIEKYCYNNDPNNCTTYGGLYQWNEAMQYVTTLGTKGICPEGWHMPTKEEFEILADEVGDRINSYSFSGGNSLKAIGQGSGGGAGTNTSGFSALLAGNRLVIGYFSGLSLSTYFWSSSEYSSINAYYVYLNSSSTLVYFDDYNKSYGFSVRCVKD